MKRQPVKRIEVSAGILINNGQILCLQRGQGKYDYISYKYEFPGGKLELGERPAEALRRELVEEMRLDVLEDGLKYYMSVEHQYPDFFLTMHAFIYDLDSRGFDLVEHIAYKWLSPERLDELDWAEADWSIVRKLMEGKAFEY